MAKGVGKTKAKGGKASGRKPADYNAAGKNSKLYGSKKKS